MTRWAMVFMVGSFFLHAGCAEKKHASDGGRVLHAEHVQDVGKRATLPDGRNYYALKATISGGRTAYIAIGGLGTAGVKAPCPDLADAPGNKIDYPYGVTTGEEIDGAVQLDQGFAWVFVKDGPVASGVAASSSSQGPQRITWITPWSIVVTRSLATGAYGTQYCVLAFPSDKATDYLMQRVYQRENKVKASSPVPKRADAKPDEEMSEPERRNVRWLFGHSLSPAKSNADDSNDANKDCTNDGHERFLLDANQFFELVRRAENWP